jgi:Zn-dependent peptidase ImmA (M78 family)
MTSKNYIVINRNDVLGARNFNYAHELFHSLTWDALTPLKVKKAYSNDKGKKPIVEKLADAFVTSILMPQDTIRAHMNLNSNDVDEEYVNALADKFLVNSPAMLVRLKSLGLITQAQFDGMDRNKLKEGRGLSKTTQPLSFNFEFASVLNEAIGEGKISVRKAAEDLNISINSLKEVFVSHNLPQVFDL